MDTAANQVELILEKWISIKELLKNAKKEDLAWVDKKFLFKSKFFGFYNDLRGVGSQEEYRRDVLREKLKLLRYRELLVDYEETRAEASDLQWGYPEHLYLIECLEEKFKIKL